MTTAIRELTVQLPQDVIEMLQGAASQRHATFDQIVAEALRFALHPVRQQALQNLERNIQQQRSQSQAEIRGHLKSQITSGEQERLSVLLERNRAEGLTEQERAELQSLFDQIEAMATSKAAALYLLSGKSPESDLLP